jgi:hypothetical protein
MIDGDDGPEELDLPLFEDGPTDGVELELDDDDVGGNLADYLDEYEEAAEDDDSAEEDDSDDDAEEPEAEEQDQVEEEEEEEEPRPRKRDPERRIAELARRAQEAERRAQEIEARLQQEASLRQQSDLAMMTHYEQRLRGDANVVLGQIEEAISMGDARKQAELQAQFNQLQSDLSGIDAWRKDAEVKMAESQKPVAPQPAQQQQVTLEPRTRDWIEKNPWFQPQSPDFDPEMHEEATMYARRIERRFKAEGRADEIGSASYFKEIDKHMRTEFADVLPDTSTPKKATPKMKRDNTVAPVVRSGGSDTPAKRTAKVTLSPAERQFARNMAASGAYKKPNGQRMSDAEAERYHAAFMLKQRKG